MPTNLNPPLTINVRVIDIKTEIEEDVKRYELKKVSIEPHSPIESQYDIDKVTETFNRQRAMLDKKWKSIQDLIIWAMNNGKEVLFVNEKDDK